ncbi:MAG: ABC transporter ATP-binding protein [Oscillospiraceae bacterium]|nr:ABC transporter ATP-binding protein [Oscillospiraceae bacterium]
MKIELKDICKRFGTSFAIEKLCMTIESGKFTTLLGPSGCGKTTILRMIAGLETPDEGEIYYDDTCVFSSQKKINLPPEKRNLGFVFQDFALFPHLKVYENVAFPLRARYRKDGLDEKVRKALKAVRLEDYADRMSEQLSGGQQQRVAFARAIVASPECILFDEPLSALDAILREEMRIEIRNLTEQLGITSVFVTHDQIEAMSMSDSIAVMNQGHVEQYGSPEEIYHSPSTKFVANFIGKSDWVDDSSMFRPEAMSFEPRENSTCYEASVVSQQFVGNGYELILDHDGNRWVALSPVRQLDEKVSVYVYNESIQKF